MTKTIKPWTAREQYLNMVWRRFLSEALTRYLMAGELGLQEAGRRARISASLRTRAWDRKHPQIVTVAA